MRAIILDTETTGIKDPDVVELAWVQINEETWSLAPVFQQYYKNDKPIEWGAMSTHHIIPAMLVDKPGQDKIQIPMAEYIIGHNIDFDWKALKQPQIKRICTLALSRLAHPECDSHSLSSMMYYIHGANEATRTKLKNAHSAAADILLCYDILIPLMEKLDIHSLDQLYAVSEDARIPRIMQFGKHKGQPISEVPKGYRDWYRRQEETDPYVLMAFSRK